MVWTYAGTYALVKVAWLCMLGPYFRILSHSHWYSHMPKRFFNSSKKKHKGSTSWQKWSIPSPVAHVSPCDCTSANEKSSWRSFLPYKCAHNPLPLLKDQVSHLLTYLGAIFPAFYRQLSTCRFKFTCKWWFFLPMIHWTHVSMTNNQIPYNTPLH